MFTSSLPVSGMAAERRRLRKSAFASRQRKEGIKSHSYERGTSTKQPGLPAREHVPAEVRKAREEASKILLGPRGNVFFGRCPTPIVSLIVCAKEYSRVKRLRVWPKGSASAIPPVFSGTCHQRQLPIHLPQAPPSEAPPTQILIALNPGTSSLSRIFTAVSRLSTPLPSLGSCYAAVQRPRVHRGPSPPLLWPPPTVCPSKPRPRFSPGRWARGSLPALAAGPSTSLGPFLCARISAAGAGAREGAAAAGEGMGGEGGGEGSQAQGTPYPGQPDPGQ